MKKKNHLVWWIGFFAGLFAVMAFLSGHLSAVIERGADMQNWRTELIRHIRTAFFDVFHLNPYVCYFAAGLYLLAVVSAASRRELPKAEMKGTEHGSNDFQTEEERQLFLKKNTTPVYPVDENGKIRKGDSTGHESNLILSQNVKVSYNTWLTHLGSLNALIIGATGEGKSLNFVRPNIYALPMDPRTGKAISFVCTDPKGELCQDTAGYLEANGYAIKVFNINEQHFSDCYNPFRYIRSADALLIMVDSVVENANGGKTPSDPHWTNSAKSLLNSICYAVYYEFAFKDQNFATVSELLNMCGSSENDDNYKSDYDIWLDHLQEHSPMGDEHPAVVWRKKVSASGREMSSIISTAQTAVRLFASKDIQRLTNVDTLEMDKIGDRPTAFFIIIPTTNSTYNFLISMMYTQLFESLYYRAQNVFHGSLPHHVVFMQDEMANVGKIPDFDKKIATFRSVNLSTCMIVQSPNQIETVYDKAATDILDNVHMIVFLGSGGQGEKSATKWMSAALGYKTIQAEQSSVKMGKGPDLLGLDGTTVEHSYTATQRLLMTPDELYRMPSDRCIVMIKGQKPFYDYKIDLNTSLNFASDLYSEADGSRRRLKKAYFYPVNDKDPEHPSRKRTLASYHQGVKNAEVVDQEREQMQREEMMENEKYNPVANSPVRPEPQPAAEVIHADHMEHYHAAGCNDRELKVEDFFDEEENL